MGLTRLIPAWPARFTALSRAFQFGEAAGPNLEGPARVTGRPVPHRPDAGREAKPAGRLRSPKDTRFSRSPTASSPHAPW